MLTERRAGILLHPTSLPGPHGIGDIGPAARHWIKRLSEAGCSLWQVLPLGPTGYGDSPYQCFSSFANNPYLISPADLVQDGLLVEADIEGSHRTGTRIDYGDVIDWKKHLLELAFSRLRDRKKLHQQINEWAGERWSWLGDFSLFMAIKAEHGGGPWQHWPAEIRDREPGAVRDATRRLAEPIAKTVFQQWAFDRQWQRLRQVARDHDVQVVGDLPIFVAGDSSDVWANRQLFEVDSKGNPEFVAGVPPDYFSATGQLWGNPLYIWERHQETGYSWWLSRLDAVLRTADIVRIDHFRGFHDYWRIPGGAETAVTGEWVDGPGDRFLEAVRARFHELPIIAEDLGELSPGVYDLRDRFELPGMKILQFAFTNEDDNPFLPHHYPENCIVYTGTHDNDTTIGWYESAPEDQCHQMREYLDVDGSDPAWHLIEAALESRAAWAIVPLQDVQRLGTKARMNTPGTAEGNWQWRTGPEPLTDAMVEELGSLVNTTGRAG